MKKMVKTEDEGGDTCEEMAENEAVGGHSTFEYRVPRRLGC